MASTTEEILKAFQGIMKQAGMEGFILMMAKRHDGNFDVGHVGRSIVPAQILAPLAQVTADLIKSTLDGKIITDPSAFDGGPFVPPSS